VLQLPPLRARTGDVALLARHFARTLAAAAGTAPPRLGEATLSALVRLPWRGNVRELENWMRRAVMLYPDREPEMAPVGSIRSVADATRPPLAPPVEDTPPTLNLRELERRTILRALEIAGGNRTRASQALGISIRTLRNKIHEFGLADQ
jgi:DNA-binding NtrC family response regulator